MMNQAKKAYDAIIIGAGHNGLVAGNYLTKAGKKVLILQKRHLVGGAALTQQLIPGFKFSRCSYVLSLLRPQIIKDLNLFERGLKVHYRQISSLTPTKQPDKYLLFHRDPNLTLEQISKWSKHDSQQWPKYQTFLTNLCNFWDRQVDTLPYNSLQKPTLKDKLRLLNNMLPRSIDVFEVSKFITSSVEQSLNDWFESEILKGTLATDGIIGENLSIGDPATGYVLLHHVMGALEEERKGEWGYVEGGNGRLSEILRDIYLEKGGELRLNCAVDKILYDGKKPVAVRLADGEIIQGKNIMSNCTNQVTFEHLIDNPQNILTKQQINKIRSIEYNGAATKINLALKQLPRFKSFKNHPLPPHQLLQGTIHLNCQSLSSLKQCYNHTKTTRISPSPFLDLTIPSVLDKTLCPQGYFIMNALMQYTPYHSNTASSRHTEISHSSVREAFLDVMNEYLIQPLEIHYMDILTPFDLERLLGMTEGNIFHGAIGLDNILFNRMSGRVGGVWICGSAAHPGGGVMGASGRQAALEVLKHC